MARTTVRDLAHGPPGRWRHTAETLASGLEDSVGRAPGRRARARPARAPGQRSDTSVTERDARVEDAVGDVASALSCSARKNCWNTNPILDARSAASPRSLIRADVQAGDPHRSRWWAGPGCPSGAAASTCPTPTGRRWRSAPRPAPPGSPRPAPAPAADPGYTLDAWSSSSTGTVRRRGPGPALRVRRSRRRHHDALPGGQRPGHLHQPVESSSKIPGRHRHVAPRVARADDLDDVPARSLREQGAHRHRRAPCRALLAVVMFTVTGAWSSVPAADGSRQRHRAPGSWCCAVWPSRGGRHRADRRDHSLAWSPRPAA